MRYPASEKLEIIRIVEQSHLPAKRTLDQLGIARRTFYRWYDRFLEGGPEALDDRPSAPNRVWNRIGDDIQDQIVEMALDYSELSPRELAVRFTDEKRYFVSEATVYRLLKAHDLITSPAVNGGGKTSQMAAQKSASFGGVSLFGWRPFPRPGLTFLGRRAQPRSRMAAGHRGAARSVLDGGEHGGNLARGGLIFPCWRRVSLGAAGSGTSVRAGFLLCRRRGCRSLLWPVCLCLDLGLARAALAEAVAVGVHLEDADVMCQAIEQRAG